MDFIDLNAQLASMRKGIDTRIKRVLDHGKFIMGPEVQEVEHQLADYVGVKHCISCANGTDALQLSLMALGVGPGDIVFTTAFSFFATAEVIPLVGATPYFVDIEPDTYNLSVDSLKAAIADVKARNLGNGKAVIAVDLFGLPAHYPELEPLCEHHGLQLIEDAAQGFGGAIGARKAGSFGHIATTSFFPAKPLGCYGDGGAIFTQSDDLAALCRSLRVHGKGQHKYDNVRVGLNSRLDTIQAAILLEKLVHFEQERHLRAELASFYAAALSDDFQLPIQLEGVTCAWAQFTLRSLKVSRQECLAQLAEQGVPTGIYYPVPLNASPAMQIGFSQPTPAAEQAAAEVFSIPMSPYMSAQERTQVVTAMRAMQVISA